MTNINETSVSVDVHPRCMLVVPCYNEEQRLPVEVYREFLSQCDWVEYMFVDDGSSDHTWDVLQRFAGESDRVHAIKLARNSGKAEAVRKGLLAAVDCCAPNSADFIAYWDADLATPLDELLPMLKLFDDERRVHSVTAARVCMMGRNVQRKALRHYVGRIFASLASLAIGQHFYDTQCGAKIFRTSDAVKTAISMPFQDRWSFDVELLQRLFKITGTSDCVIEHPLQTWTDVGESSVSMMGGLRAFASLAKIWFNKSKKSGSGSKKIT